MSDLEGRLSRVEAVASPVLEAHGLSLVDAEWRREGRRWVLGNQGRVDMLLAAHCMQPIEKLYASVFEGILGERISTRPVEIVDPFPWRNRK